MKRLLALSCLLAGSTLSHADNLLYGNNATNGSPYVFQIDKTTGAVLNTYSNLSGNNGRGVVVVGDTMYYTSAGTNSIYSYTLSTHTNNGAVFSIAGASGLSTIAYDGTHFYIGDYSGTNAVYEYTPTGTLISTLHLQNCTGFCDGLEYFIQNGVGSLIENRGDTVGLTMFTTSTARSGLLTSSPRHLPAPAVPPASPSTGQISTRPTSSRALLASGTRTAPLSEPSTSPAAPPTFRH